MCDLVPVYLDTLKQLEVVKTFLSLCLTEFWLTYLLQFKREQVCFNCVTSLGSVSLTQGAHMLKGMLGNDSGSRTWRYITNELITLANIR